MSMLAILDLLRVLLLGITLLEMGEMSKIIYQLRKN
jgi:hypothetical protein